MKEENKDFDKDGKGFVEDRVTASSNFTQIGIPQNGYDRVTKAKIKTGRSFFHDWLNTAHTFYLKSMSILKSFKNSTNLDQAETSSLSRFEMT